MSNKNSFAKHQYATWVSVVSGHALQASILGLAKRRPGSKGIVSSMPALQIYFIDTQHSAGRGLGRRFLREQAPVH